MRTKHYLAEFLGTAFLLATVIGSGIMGETLANGNTAVALLGNTIPTGAILFVLITILGPISGAHFNPAVTIAFLIRGELSARDGVAFIVVQIIGGILGVWAAHAMFDMSILQTSTKLRAGPAQGFSEIVAANPAVTIARTLSDTFAGINPANAPLFIGCQLIGMAIALVVAKVLFTPQR